MTEAERRRRTRCAALRLAALLGVLLAAFSFRDWAIIAIGLTGSGIALAVYWHDCRRPRDNPTHTRAE
jgi:hypothetical protein